ncbi:AAA family ATPase [Actinomadura algeriensis]|uniref:Energy-coupling factor transporter ATP-binding protein EcfA2 n=1 Tax=Actinomadura algeriensis TaxID=1679523 RepID=A0ABR9JIF4_9ACTN|nr:AAA family ATPase [Actinomadura algeriensis]MBE1530307.1 energy-coupling factor transporter ATP-binding protein EcfA2 [Actinomadura algeriensis]
MTPPAEQSAVHDEEAGSGPGPRERASEAPEQRTASAGRTVPAVRDEPDSASESAPENDTTEKDEAEKKGKVRARGKHARRDADEHDRTDDRATRDEDVPGAGGESGVSGDPGETAGEGADERPARRDPRAGAGTIRQGELIQALKALRERLGAFEFVLDLPGAAEGREVRDELRAQIEDYVLPRIQAAGTPLLVVLGGSTGAGKSTLVNTLVGSRVSATGVLRPTTSSPILVCHPDHVDWFLEGALLPGMGRVRGPAPDAIAGDQLVVIASEALPPGLALLDSPDFDSVFEDHYEFATKLMAAADLWLCVTTAARYADAMVWQMIERAKENGATVGVVLSRVPQGSAGAGAAEVVEHFGEMLDEHGLGDARRFTVPETRIEESRLPEEAVAGVREWLTGVAADNSGREIVVGDTLAAVLDSIRDRVSEIGEHVEAQAGQRAELARAVETGYGDALAELDEATRDGSLLRGEALARWQDFAGTGDLLRSLHVQRARKGRGSNRRRRSPTRVRALKAALRSSLESLIIASAERGAEKVLAQWREHPAGGPVVSGPAAEVGTVSPELARRVTRAVSAWQDHVQELIRTEGVTKRSVAKLVSFDTEAVSLVLTVGLLGHGASEEGGAVPQRLLKALFGAESLRGMGAKARADLRSRIAMLFDEEAIRFGQVLDAAGIPDETVPVQLYQATYNLEVAR